MTRISCLEAVAGVAALIVVATGVTGCAKPPTVPTPTGGTLPAQSVTISSVSPNAGIGGAETLVVVTGAGFRGGVTLTFGGVPATVTAAYPNAITARAPALGEGPVDVIVTNTDTGSATLAGGYTYHPVVLTATPDAVAAGRSLSVTWSVLSGRSRFDWIGLFPVDAPSTSYLDSWWQYTEGAATGGFTLDAPARPGVYEFRYLVDDGYVDVARRTVTVRP